MKKTIFEDVVMELDRRQYKEALSIFKKLVDFRKNGIDFNRSEFLNEIKRTRILINLSKDKDRNRCFCIKAINYLKYCKFNCNYFDQCEYINEYFKIYNQTLQETLKNLKKFIYPEAILRLTSSFENLNQILLMQDKERLSDEIKNMFFPISYENNIETLNQLLKECMENNNKKRFGKKFTYEDILNASPLSLDKDVLEDLNRLSFLKWLVEEITIHDMEIRVYDEHVEFVYLEIDKYIKYKLPFIREEIQNQHIDATYFYDRINQQINKEYNISDFIDLSNNNRNFTLQLTNSILGEFLLKSAEIGEKEENKISDINMISDLSQLTHNEINMKSVFMFYFCLRGLSEIYFNATKQFITDNGNLPQTPVLLIKVEQLYELFSYLFSSKVEPGLNREIFENRVSFYSFGNDNIFDLYYKPLIRMDEYVLIIPSIFLCNNIYRTFIKHLRMLKVNLSKKGEIFEKQSRKLLEESGFNVYPNNYLFQYYSNNDHTEIKGDIDIIAVKDKYIFVGEAKNHLDPLELDDYRAGNKVVKKGVLQIKKILKYIEDNKLEFFQKNLIEDEEDIIIVPFVLLSSYYGSGQIVEGIPIIDYSALDKYLSDGTLLAYSGEQVISEIRLRGDNVISKELKDFLDSPHFKGKDGCYAFHFLKRNIMNIDDHILRVNIDLKEFNIETDYKYASLFKPSSSEISGC